MNSQEYRNLSEAYLDVYQELDEATAMAKRGLDEPAIRNKIASQTRGGEFADKATKLADRETYGNKKVKADRENLARKQRGDFRNTTSSSPGLRGYGHQSSDPAVKAKQDARGAQRGSAALTPNERKQLNMESYDLFDYIMEYLITEGYADTNENALVIMANMSEDWRQSIVEEVLDEGYVDYKKGKLPSGRTPQQAAQGRSELLNAREKMDKSILGKPGAFGRRESQNRRTKEMDKLTASNPVSRAVRRGLGDMLPGGQPSTDRHSNAMDRRNRVADLASAKKKSRSRYQHKVDPNY